MCPPGKKKLSICSGVPIQPTFKKKLKRKIKLFLEQISTTNNSRNVYQSSSGLKEKYIQPRNSDWDQVIYVFFFLRIIGLHHYFIFIYLLLRHEKIYFNLFFIFYFALFYFRLNLFLILVWRVWLIFIYFEPFHFFIWSDNQSSVTFKNSKVIKLSIITYHYYLLLLSIIIILYFK